MLSTSPYLVRVNNTSRYSAFTNGFFSELWTESLFQELHIDIAERCFEKSNCIKMIEPESAPVSPLSLFVSLARCIPQIQICYSGPTLGSSTDNHQS